MNEIIYVERHAIYLGKHEVQRRALVMLDSNCIHIEYRDGYSIQSWGAPVEIRVMDDYDTALMRAYIERIRKGKEGNTKIVSTLPLTDQINLLLPPEFDE